MKKSSKLNQNKMEGNISQQESNVDVPHNDFDLGFNFIEPQQNECDSTSLITEESKVYAAFRLSKFFKIRLEISIFGRPFYVRILNPLSKIKSE